MALGTNKYHMLFRACLAVKDTLDPHPAALLLVSLSSTGTTNWRALGVGPDTGFFSELESTNVTHRRST